MHHDLAHQVKSLVLGALKLLLLQSICDPQINQSMSELLHFLVGKETESRRVALCRMDSLPDLSAMAGDLAFLSVHVERILRGVSPLKP